jgi:hypothetical protein
VSVNGWLVLYCLIVDRHGLPLSIVFVRANSAQARGQSGEEWPRHSEGFTEAGYVFQI